jgi:iron-sulfur cluster assembly accessory protein
MILTDSAKTKINDLCRQHGKLVRLSVESGGCQGFNKVWDFDQSVSDDDVEFACGTGSLIVDQSSLDIIDTATVDYKVSLDGSYFTVDIPAATGTCGCGNSFSI